MANSVCYCKLVGDDLAADDDLVDHGNRSRRKEFYRTPRPFLLGTPLISRLPVLLKKIANGPMPLKLMVVAHGICLEPLPFASEGGMPINDVKIVIFVKYIECLKFCNMCVWEGGRQPVRLTT